MSSTFTVPAARPESVMKKLTFTDSNNTLFPYRLYIPPNYRKDQKYPLLLFLHGAGERGTDNTKHIESELISHVIHDIKDCIIVAPQCAEEYQWVDTPWRDGAYNQDDIPISKYLAATRNLITYIQETYSVDRNRLYISGLSMGGFGTWDMITRFPDLFAAAVPVCGASDPSKAALIKDIPIWTFHSTDDPCIPVSGTKKMVYALKAIGGKITYTEYNDQGHASWTKAYSNIDLYRWLFRQDKSGERPIGLCMNPNIQ